MFPRVDIETYPGDPGFSAYVAMLREDHEHNSPAVAYTTGQRCLICLCLSRSRCALVCLRLRAELCRQLVPCSSAQVSVPASPSSSLDKIALAADVSSSVGAGAGLSASPSEVSARADVALARAQQRLRVMVTLLNNPQLAASAGGQMEGLRK